MATTPHKPWQGADGKRRYTPKKRAGEGTGDLFFPPSPDTLAVREARQQAAKARGKATEPPPMANPRERVVKFLQDPALQDLIDFAIRRGDAMTRNKAAVMRSSVRRLLQGLNADPPPSR